MQGKSKSHLKLEALCDGLSIYSQTMAAIGQTTLLAGAYDPFELEGRRAIAHFDGESGRQANRKLVAPDITTYSRQNPGERQ